MDVVRRLFRAEAVAVIRRREGGKKRRVSICLEKYWGGGEISTKIFCFKDEPLFEAPFQHLALNEIVCMLQLSMYGAQSHATFTTILFPL